MNTALIIPNNAIKFILFQRTAYLRFPVAPVYRLFNRVLPFQTPLYNLVVAIESRFGAARVKALYQADIYNEYQSFKNWLPPSCTTVLDIGCGVAGIDVFLYRHYAAQHPRLYLLDQTRIEKNVFYLFNTQGAFYNSLDVARRLLIDNSVPDQHIHLIEANSQNTIAVESKIDLVVSLLSWGFHYPVGTYAQQVHAVLNDAGSIILDVRKGTSGLDTLQQIFRQVEVIMETAKYQRVVARK